jgi:hypothetical protein
MGSDKVVWLEGQIPAFGTRAVDVGATLPGLAWPLDDETFARFAATLPSPPVAEGEGRFGERARLVEGPFRAAWIAWRCAEVARFHARLAAAVAAVDPRWPLHIVPTTLFAVGDPAGAGQAVEGEAADDRVRLAGYDPAAMHALPEADRVVYVWPRVHAPADGVWERAVVATANRSAAVSRAAAASRRRPYQPRLGAIPFAKSSCAKM